MKIPDFLKATAFSAFFLTGALLNLYILQLITKEQQEQQKTMTAWRKKKNCQKFPAQFPPASGPFYRTKNGEKYHSKPHCSNNEYFLCTRQEIQNLRLTPCKRCVK